MTQHTDATGFVHLDAPAPVARKPRQKNLPAVQEMLDAQKVARRFLKTLKAMSATSSATRVLGLVQDEWASHIAERFQKTTGPLGIEREWEGPGSNATGHVSAQSK